MHSVALVGRVNVGKSTLFNRLTETTKTIVSAQPGTTRDRHYATCLWRGETFTLIDTGGIVEATKDIIQTKVNAQVALALKEADMLLWILDGQVGITEEDRHMAKVLRATKKPIILVVNKMDTPKKELTDEAQSWASLGWKTCYMVSATNGKGTGDLLDAVLQQLPREDLQDAPTQVPYARITIIGKPNVGKSSLLNTLIREERMIVSPIPGTTREPTDTLYTLGERQLLFMDTAGIRRKSHIDLTLEKIGVSKTLDTLTRADIALFVLDPFDVETSHQDQTLGQLIAEKKVSTIIVVNKCDLLEQKTEQMHQSIESTIRRTFPHLAFAPIVQVSTVTKKNINTLIPLIFEVHAARAKVIPQAELDAFLTHAQYQHEKTIYTKFRQKDTKRVALKDLKQIRYNPPVFSIEKNTKDPLPQGFEGFILNRFRERFPFTGTPVEFRIYSKDQKQSYAAI